jgi:predicted GIY-YIG superfamily endonuclease
MNGFIYKIVNDINDKIYIGKTLTSIEKRFSEHKRESCRN